MNATKKIDILYKNVESMYMGELKLSKQNLKRNAWNILLYM